MNRRSFLAGMATVAAASAVPLAAAAAVPDNPDAELLEAWESYRRQWLLIEAIDPGSSVTEMEPHEKLLSALGNRVERLPAKTPAGLAVKLQYLFVGYVEYRWGDEAIFQGKPCDEQLSEDYRDRMLWEMIGQAKAMSAEARP